MGTTSSKTAEERAAIVMSDQLGIPVTDITRDRELVTYGMDSLDHVEMVMAMEDEFGIEIPDDEISEAQLKTTGDFLDFVLKYVK